MYEENDTMKNVILASIGILLGSVSWAQAGVPALDLENAVKQAVAADHILLVSDDGDNGDNASDDNGSDDNGAGDDNDSDDDNGADDDSDDDNGGDRADDKSDDNKGLRVEGRRKVRVPGGSGCDDAGDVIEHPECLAK
jgi:hypothetical protein